MIKPKVNATPQPTPQCPRCKPGVLMLTRRIWDLSHKEPIYIHSCEICGMEKWSWPERRKT